MSLPTQTHRQIWRPLLMPFSHPRANCWNSQFPGQYTQPRSRPPLRQPMKQLGRRSKNRKPISNQRHLFRHRRHHSPMCVPHIAVLNEVVHDHLLETITHSHNKTSDNKPTVMAQPTPATTPAPASASIIVALAMTPAIVVMVARVGETPGPAVNSERCRRRF